MTGVQCIFSEQQTRWVLPFFLLTDNAAYLCQTGSPTQEDEQTHVANPKPHLPALRPTTRHTQ